MTIKSKSLTKRDKEIMIAAIMADAPKPDFAGEMQTLVQNYHYTLFPESVKDIYDDPETRNYLYHEWTHYNGRYVGGYVIYKAKETPLWSNKLDEQADEIRKRAEEHCKRRNRIELELIAAFSVIKTTKQFRESYPEFVKYLGEEHEEPKHLPSVANAVELLKELGWPKEKLEEVLAA